MAQIVTITNPLTGQPAQVDQLDHTAQQIDDAIARALPGGGIDTLLAGKAPAGYGLGSAFNSASDANTLVAFGCYATKVNTPTGDWCTILHIPYGENNATQYAKIGEGYDYQRQCTSKRDKIKGTWQPWEWVNPPMQLGVEYRTTERYLVKPVYCMTKFVGEVAANTVTQVIFNESDIGGYCIRSFCTGKRTFSNWEDNRTAMVSSPAGSETIITCDPTIYRLSEGNRSIRAYIKSNVNLKDVYCTAYYTKWAD